MTVPCSDPCPHCGGYCISRWARAGLGPARSARCETCGQRVSVAWLPATVMLVLIVFVSAVGGLVAVFYLKPLGLSWSAPVFAVGGLITSAPFWLLWPRVVPLVGRGGPPITGDGVHR